MGEPSQKFRTLIIDPQTLFREGLRSLLSSDPEIEIVGEAEDGHEAIRLATKLKPNLMLMELLLPIIHGVEVIREVKEQSPETKIIAVTVYRTDDYILDSLKAGIHGYCLKDTTYEELTLAIKRVLAEGTYLDPRITDVPIEKYIDERKTSRVVTSRFQALTGRERQTLKLVAEGYRSKEIAEILGISINTVRNLRNKVMSKLELHSVAALIGFALEERLVSWF